MSVEIMNVDKGSLAEEYGIKAGELLVEINDHPINDVLDYGFYSAAECVSLCISSGGALRSVVIEKDEYADIGLDFDSFLMDSQHSCANDCIFCFVDQLPRNMRESLYFKDDDDRLSYLFGNYLTLTNISDEELDRIIKMRITPINISVQTTDPELRRLMLRNEHAGELMPYMRKLAQNNIEMNCQIVVCRGINDGEKLKNTLDELMTLYPAVQSIAVVPVGLTDHRDGLFPLDAHDAESASEMLDLLLPYSASCRERFGVGVVYPADEWFVLAGRDVPAADFYDEYLQYDNGVGMIARTREQFANALANAPAHDRAVVSDIATGVAAAPELQRLAALAKQKFPNIECRVHAVENNFFGKSITVAGLVTATDILAQVNTGSMAGDTLYFPKVMLRSEEDMFLDSITVEQLGERLMARVCPVDTDGEALFEVMTGQEG